jgi:Periplasmic binding protein
MPGVPPHSGTDVQPAFDPISVGQSKLGLQRGEWPKYLAPSERCAFEAASGHGVLEGSDGSSEELAIVLRTPLRRGTGGFASMSLSGRAGASSACPSYAVRPRQVRREKPRVSAFTSADIPRILALDPDLVLTFSDLQAEIAADIIRADVAVYAFNQRDVAGILAMIRTLADKAEALARGYEAGLPKRRPVFVDGRGRKSISRNGMIL